jgi:vacuolar-type H+-ATPase subunit F/Vma7
MSRLWAIVRPGLVTGFQLGGVETFGAEDIETAEELIGAWLDDNDPGLLLLEDSFLAYLDQALFKRLDGSNNQFWVAIPGGGSLGPEATRSARIAKMVRRALGLRVDFRRQQGEVTDEQTD